ncbi:hypothetical protein RND71_021904 [Anisodus tanguticus]|uniref:Uncharacterized protein n=1 Tax=Anisodus tanguticus TaxID=243964 RepID=A0AAE1RXE6_9SOLA|nr:hypothetical protein RND71_021904 [Anisodus tanguticus]
MSRLIYVLHLSESTSKGLEEVMSFRAKDQTPGVSTACCNLLRPGEPIGRPADFLLCATIDQSLLFSTPFSLSSRFSLAASSLMEFSAISWATLFSFISLIFYPVFASLD